jgi:HlyD family secretion protein
VTVDEDGKTRIKEKYVVSSPLAGRLLRIVMDPGDLVTRGESLLASIMPRDPQLLDQRELASANARVEAQKSAVQRAEAEVGRTRAALTLAETELARARTSQQQQVISRQELDQAEATYRLRSEEFRAAKFSEDIARFELAQAEAALLTTDATPDESSPAEHFTIFAPITGRVLRVFQESATIVTPGTELLELGDPVDLEVEVDVLSNDAVRVIPGAKVILEHWGGERPLEGVVRLVEPAAFTKVSALGVEEQRVNVIVDLVDPPERRPTLGDGYRVEARIVVWSDAQVQKIPTSALFRDGSIWSVFTVVMDRVEKREVTVGEQNGLEAQILAGLRVGDKIVLHPSDKLDSGTHVAIRGK